MTLRNNNGIQSNELRNKMMDNRASVALANDQLDELREKFVKVNIFFFLLLCLIQLLHTQSRKYECFFTFFDRKIFRRERKKLK
jgi:hypothetical protein